MAWRCTGQAHGTALRPTVVSPAKPDRPSTWQNGARL